MARRPITTFVAITVLGVGAALLASPSAAGLRARGFVRACATQPSGVSVPRGYRSSSAAVGPLALFGFGKLTNNGLGSFVPASRFAPVGTGSYRVFKLWAILPPGRAVTVSVPRGERGVLSLAYDPSLWNRGGWDGRARVGDGASTVNFAACSRKSAQGDPPHVVYDGGLIAARARCARLNVRAKGWRRARSIVVALGRRRC